jgi:hypothetical protein
MSVEPFQLPFLKWLNLIIMLLLVASFFFVGGAAWQRLKDREERKAVSVKEGPRFGKVESGDLGN